MQASCAHVSACVGWGWVLGDGRRERRAERGLFGGLGWVRVRLGGGSRDFTCRVVRFRIGLRSLSLLN